MKVCIFGATGMVGKVLTRAAIDEGHEVVACVRSPEKLGELSAQIRVIHGDYFDPATQRRALEGGVDTVLTTIGPPMKRGGGQHDYAAAMISLLAAMEEASVSRIVAIGGAGLKLEGEQLSLRRRLMRRILILLAGSNYLNKEAEHNVLARSNLDWTIVRPPQITDIEGELKVSLNDSAGMSVDTAQLAAFILDCVNDEASIRTAPFVATVRR